MPLLWVAAFALGYGWAFRVSSTASKTGAAAAAAGSSSSSAPFLLRLLLCMVSPAVLGEIVAKIVELESIGEGLSWALMSQHGSWTVMALGTVCPQLTLRVAGPSRH